MSRSQESRNNCPSAWPGMIAASGREPRVILAAALAATLLGGCGDELAPATPDAAPVVTVDAGSCATPASARLLPLAVGTTWTYQVTASAGATPVLKKNTVEAYEDVGGRKAGTQAFRVRTEKTDGATVSWQEDRCDAVVRHREQTFSLANALTDEQFYQPSKPRVDESAAHTALGATWTSAYTEVTVDPATGAETTKTKVENWTVEAVDEDVTVPAGTFRCIRLHKVGADAGQADKRFWFAPGVGKIKEEGDQLEELASYALAGS
jgi:hypothetical protein